MKLRHTIITAAAALAVASAPGVASASGHGKPSSPASQSTSPRVMHVLRGVVSTVTTGTGTTRPASVEVTIQHGNFWKQLGCSPTCDETFTIGSSTKVVLHDRLAVATGDRVIVKIRAPKDETAAALAAADLSVFQLIDQGAPKTTA